MFYSSFMVQIWEIVRDELGKGLGPIIIGITIALITGIAELLRRAWLFFHRLWRARRDVARSTDENGILVEGRGVWVAQPIRKPERFKHNIDLAKILMIANLKGGVCKTTLTANVGAYLSLRLTKPVLLIDLDFQGTLSAMASPGNWLPNGGDSKATQLISDDVKVQHVADIMHHALGGPQLYVLGSYYDLAQAENRIMVEWLIGSRKKDIRYTLADILHSDVVRERYGLIIIDAPPRLTTAAIQAVCASSHLLIPTIMDRPSAEAAIRFVRQIETLKGREIGGYRGAPLNPHIKHVGIVGTMMNAAQNVTDIENLLNDRLNAPFENDGCGGVTKIVDPSLYFHGSTQISSRAGTGIAYYQLGNNQNVQQIKYRIEKLGDHIAEKMYLERRC